jgi:two-component system, NtrC family, sensor kinase
MKIEKQKNVVKDTSYKRFFELSVDILCIVNLQGIIVEVNDACVRVLGLPKSQLVGRPLFELIHPSDVVETKKIIKKLSEGELVFNFINRYRHINGCYLTFSWSGQYDAESKFIYAVARNITEERNQAYKLTQIEKMLEAETILVETDRQGIIHRANDKFCQISGYSKEELIGKTHKLINSGYHPREFFTSMWQTISNKKVWSGIIKNRKKNGDYYYVQTIITPIIDHEGSIVRYLAIRQDITDSVRQESDLAKIMTLFQETSAIAKVGGWELDIATGELIWTDETFRILEVEKNASHNPNLPQGLKLFTPEHQPLIEDAVNRGIERGEPYALELEACTAKGNVLWVFTTGKANYRDGKIVSLSGIIQDIDARKKAEQKYNLERQKSIQSAKLASLGELAASMAHEINNPLSIIYGYTDLMLQDHALPEGFIDKLKVVNRSCERISHLVNNLKKFSRTEDAVEYSNQSISMIINDAISLTLPRLKRELVDIRFVQQSTALISCNSIDAVRELAEKWISISIIDRDDKIEIQVQDSGEGIPETIQAKIFSPFYTSKKIDEGTGLGLSIVRRILKFHEASIYYSSQTQNTCFVITFNKVKES